MKEDISPEEAVKSVLSDTSEDLSEAEGSVELDKISKYEKLRTDLKEVTEALKKAKEDEAEFYRNNIDVEHPEKTHQPVLEFQDKIKELEERFKILESNKLEFVDIKYNLDQALNDDDMLEIQKRFIEVVEEEDVFDNDVLYKDKYSMKYL